jgi:hypothetical protein
MGWGNNALTYSEARKLMNAARHPERGKPLANNTRLFERHNGDTVLYSVRLHSTDIVDIYPNYWVVRTGSWYTSTTRSRIYDYAPISWSGVYGRNATQRVDSDGWWLTQTGPDGEMIPFDDAELGPDGQVTRRYWNELARAYRQRKNEAQVMNLERRKQEREQRRMARFAEEIRRERAKNPSIEVVAANVARELSFINERLRPKVSA